MSWCMHRVMSWCSQNNWDCVVCTYHVCKYEMWNVYECIFVWENKSLTNVGEFVKSWTTVEEYVCLQALLRIFLPGIPVLLFWGELRWGILKTLWGECLFLIGERVQESLLSVALTGESKLNWYLVGSRFHSNLLGMWRLTIIWSDPGFIVIYPREGWINYYLVGSRLHSNSLKLNSHLVGSRLYGLLESCTIIWSNPGFIVSFWESGLIVIWSGSRFYNKLFKKLSSGRV